MVRLVIIDGRMDIGVGKKSNKKIDRRIDSAVAKYKIDNLKSIAL